MTSGRNAQGDSRGVHPVGRLARTALGRLAKRLLVGSLALALTLGPADVSHAEDTHTVAEGQSLWKIAKRYNVSVTALCKKNGLAEDAALKPGTVLDIPSPEEAKRLEKKSDKKQDDKKPSDKKQDDKKSDKAEAEAKEKPEEKPEKNVPFYMRQPSQRTQTQKTSEQRGGVNPCMTKDIGFGIYDPWNRAPTIGQMIMPGRGGVSKSGAFDLVVHFHGHEAARKEFVKVMDGAVLVGIDLGIGSGAYSSTFSMPRAFPDLVESVEKEVARKRGIKSAKVRKILLSAWSAGYGAVQQILTQDYGKSNVDAVFLLDGLHTGYSGDGLDETQLDPFVKFAKRAKAGAKLMVVTHSSIIPPGYASTTETANFLIYKLGGKPIVGKPRKNDPAGLEMNSRYDAGNFHVRGYDGNDKPDHCAHLILLRDMLKAHIKPRWKSPKGSKAATPKP